jgi:holo-[acyl-carrier protein] synthase
MIGLGIDAVSVNRFREALNRTPNLRTRIFTEAELSSLASRADVAPSLAVRFAAREATMKALGVGLGAFDLHDVSICNSELGAPELVVTGRAAVLAQERGVKSWLVSLSHTEDTAIAIVASN